MKKLRILVIEDSKIHQESARATLEGHIVVIAETFHDGMSWIVNGYSSAKREQEGKTTFDVVLTDMMLPVDLGSLSMADRRKFPEGTLAPYGFSLALRAAQEGIPFVAMVSQGNHHADPVCHSLDYLGGPSYQGHPPILNVNGGRVIFTHAPTTKNGAKDWGMILRDLIGDQ
ncbi:hypothetical protein A3D69_02400 [Candidatus Uhrbacteria bacterium RIFCSPHIGHO2_02_FULL_54_11]|nr:MAG: hypothetical protein A3D69_02400 [Candidatus Uhrbacteria bacterium RIFCSPHIGHO2_02_FULL_54_11]